MRKLYENYVNHSKKSFLFKFEKQNKWEEPIYLANFHSGHEAEFGKYFSLS